MGTASVDLSKLTDEQRQALEAAGALSIPAVQPALPATSAQPVKPSLEEQLAQTTQQIGAVLSTGVAGSQAAKAGQTAELAAGIGTVIWELFNPSTNQTSQHASLADAVNQSSVDMHKRQKHAVDTKSTSAHALITPKVLVTAADVAQLETPVLPPKADNVKASD